MNIYLVLLIIFAVISILALVYFIEYSTIKKYKDRMDKAESLIEINLNKKLDLINNLNNQIKKVTGKKDYLKNYVSIKNSIITNIEKDMKLTEAEKLIKKLSVDYDELNNNKEFKKTLQSLRKINESLTSAKNMFNSNALNSNNEIKAFPNNVIAKIGKFNIRSFYNNKTDDGDTF